MENLKPNYNCSQDALYASCALVITSLEEELVWFTDLKPKYDADFVTALFAELEAARNIPALSQRQSEQEVARINLLAKLTLCLNKLNSLRLYIKDAYLDAAIRRVRMQEAGFDDYAKAAETNWEKWEAIMNNAKNFIGLHEADLLFGDNMPASFKVAFEALAATVNSDVVAMLNMRENNKQGTSGKILANNAIYAKVVSVCEDGAFIFKNDAAKASQFMWRSVLEIISPAGAAGLKGEVKDGVSSVLLVGAIVTLKLADLHSVTAVSDDDGRFEFKGLAAGVYNGKVTMEFYGALDFTVTIRTGVKRRKNILLQAVE